MGYIELGLHLIHLTVLLSELLTGYLLCLAQELLRRERVSREGEG